MFTGIVEERGTVASLEGTKLTIRSRVAARAAAIGDSVAVNGTCLTLVGIGDDTLSFDLSGETLARTAISRLAPGDPVNLERPATLVTRLGGHLVQGHVDGVGEVSLLRPEPGGGARLSVRLPSDLVRFVVEKGSIALDGVSLTVAAVDGDVIEVALIPHTLAATTFGSSGVGDPVNVEVDVVAKYVARNVERLLGERAVPAQPEDGTADGAVEARGRTAWTSA
jgi:riboflavin synthase